MAQFITFLAMILAGVSVSAGQQLPWQPTCSLPLTAQALDPADPPDSPENIFWSAFLARIVQLPPAEFKAQIQLFPKEINKIFTIKHLRYGPQGEIFETEDAIFIILRGTQEPIDYILNADFVAVNGAKDGFPGRVVHGFLTGFRIVKAPFAKAFTPFIHSRKPLWIVGHSLGGAIAQLLAFHLARNNYNVRAVLAYASPVVGDVNFASHYNQLLGDRTLVFTHGDDITPHVPPIAEVATLIEPLAPRFMRGLVRSLLSTNPYGLTGRRFTVAANTLPMEIINPLQNETSFWQRVLDLQITLPGIFLKNRHLIDDHMVDHYLCHSTGVVLAQ